MRDVIEVSYTGDLLAHRRCARAWAYDKQAGFYPYEQVQAMEGRLIHHAMEWLTEQYGLREQHVPRSDAEEQLNAYFRVLWGRGVRTAFASKKKTVDRILGNLYGSELHLRPTVATVIEAAQHTEYELRTVKKLLPLDHDGKTRLLLTGILDVVIQQSRPLTYNRIWTWSDLGALKGMVSDESSITAKEGDLEIWDYKGSRADSKYTNDYVRQLLTYARLYRERTGRLPVRCVIFYLNEPAAARGDIDRQLLAIDVDEKTIEAAERWTIEQVRRLQDSIATFIEDPESVSGGRLETGAVDAELKQQCTACGYRFDCESYRKYLRSPLTGNRHPDIDIYNVEKN